MINIKKLIFLFAIIILLFITYFIFSNSNEWTQNKKDRIEIFNKNFPQLNSKRFLNEFIENTSYVAIVYPKASLVYPNSWFHRIIMGNPFEGTSYLIKANVEFTLIGKEYDSITYSSANNLLPPYPVLVGLCLMEDSGELYAPDNGYEIPATNETIQILKSLDKNQFKHKTTSICP